MFILGNVLPMGMRIPRLKIKTMLESNPLKSRTEIRRLAVSTHDNNNNNKKKKKKNGYYLLL